MDEKRDSENPPPFEELYSMISKDEARRKQKQKRKDSTLKDRKSGRAQLHAETASPSETMATEDVITEQHQFRQQMD